MNLIVKIACAACMAVTFVSCGLRKQTSDQTITMQPSGPTFMADSAYQFCQQQCDFGPRTMNSDAHERCAQ